MAIYQVPKEKYEARANYYLSTLNEIKRQPDSSAYKNAYLDEEWAKAVAEFYFLLNYAYKDLRQIPANHGTEPSKIAALTSVAMCTLQLLRPLEGDKLDTYNDALFNPLFGIRCACDQLSINLLNLSPEEEDRLFRSFIKIDLICSHDYFLALKTNKHRLGDEIEFNLHDEDIRILEDKISLFHFLEIAVNGPLISTRLSDT